MGIKLEQTIETPFNLDPPTLAKLCIHSPRYAPNPPVRISARVPYQIHQFTNANGCKWYELVTFTHSPIPVWLLTLLISSSWKWSSPTGVRALRHPCGAPLSTDDSSDVSLGDRRGGRFVITSRMRSIAPPDQEPVRSEFL